MTFTEVDSDGDITVTVPNLNFSTMRRDANSYVYKDFGAGYFGNFDIDFEVEITGGSGQGLAGLVTVSNTAGTVQDHILANDGIYTFAYQNDSDLRIYLGCRNTDGQDFYTDGGTTSN